MNAYIRKYLNECKKELLSFDKEEKEFINRLQENLLEYELHENSITYSKIIQRFGEPEDVAATYISQLDKDLLSKKINKNKRIRKYVLIALITIVIILTSIKAYYYNQALDEVKNQQPTQTEEIIGEVN